MSDEPTIDSLIVELDSGGCEDPDAAVAELLARLPDAVEDPDDEYRVVRTLEVLRKWRRFTLLLHFCERVDGRTSDALDVTVQRYWAQGLIDMKDRDKAREVLDRLQSRVANTTGREKSEALGLLGRFHKEVFLDDGDVGDLVKSIGFYESGFELDPAWHGANLVALTAFAERHQLHTGNPLSAVEQADRLLRKLRQEAEAFWNPWTFAAAGEANLAKGNREETARYFSAYWRQVRSPFALAGTERQLREVWLAGNPEDEPWINDIMAHLTARRLSMAHGNETLTPDEISQLAESLTVAKGEAEALFGSGAAIPLERMLDVMNAASFVCRIRQKNVEGKGGTGFLVEGEGFSEELAGQYVILTNHHVLHGPEADSELLDQKAYENSVPIRKAVAEFHYWNQEPGIRQLKLDRIVYWSPRDELDFAVATLQSQPENAKGLTLSTESGLFGSPNNADPKQRDKVFVVGHPGGKSLSFSFTDNEVVDHELTSKEPRLPGVRRIHYRAPTEGGSSGSPVFHHEDIEVVGLHRTGNAAPMRDPWPGKARGEDPYQANEAVAIRSIMEHIAKQ